MRDRASGSMEGNGLLEPYEGLLSSTVLRKGGDGDAAPLPDTTVEVLQEVESTWGTAEQACESMVATLFPEIK
jgi:hypothetical protein